MISLLLLLACTGVERTPVPTGCGDGFLDPGEDCDDAFLNSDIEPDACRADCALPGCGDRVVDVGEACDDGNPWGGDGCTPGCSVETGTLEEEPNDSWEEAQDWEGQPVYGALPAGDRDCYGLDMPACGALGAVLTEGCQVPALLSLVDPAGALVARGSPEATGCALLDPVEAPGARFLEAGTWSVCVEGLNGEVVPAYALELEEIDPEDATFPMDSEDDPDGDGRPDRCDDDRDGDGVLDEDDNCPDVPNGVDPTPLWPSDTGYIRTWLMIGPFTGERSPDTCLPTGDRLAADDGAVAPALGDEVDDKLWFVHWSSGDRVDYLGDYGHVDAPREVYTAVYVYSEAEQPLTLAHGPDDGARVWLNGAVVSETEVCQGTVADRYQAEVVLEAGWNRVLYKVYDQGGGWGAYFRFLDADGQPVTDLELSLSPEGSWAPGQSDLDGDGLGDVCDPTPLGGE